MTTQIEERLLRDLSTKECAWVLGRKLGFAAIESAQHAPTQRIKEHFDEALFCAERLSATLPPLPPQTSDQTRDGQRALLYLLRDAGGAVADSIVAQHSKTHRALFETGLKLQILYWIYQPRFDMALALCEAIERAVHEAHLPTPLWSGLIEKARTHADLLPAAAIDRVRAELRATERAIWAHLLPGQAQTTNAPETPSVSKRKRAWELGQHLATAVVDQAQGDPAEVVRSSFQRAEALAVDLGTRLPPLPPADPRDPRKSSADAVTYLLRDAGLRLITHLRAEHGVAHAALFEITSKAVLLDWLYAPGDELSKTLAQNIINSASQEANLPRRYWWALFQQILQKSPTAQVKTLLAQALTETAKNLSDKSKGVITVGDKRALTLPFNKDIPGGLILMTTFNGRLTVPMLYDTGATTTIIGRATAQRLGLSTTNAIPFSVSTANGLNLMHLIEIDSIEVSGARVEGPFELAVSDAPDISNIAGLLGLNFSRAFVTTVDYERNTITLKAR